MPAPRKYPVPEVFVQRCSRAWPLSGEPGKMSAWLHIIAEEKEHGARCDGEANRAALTAVLGPLWLWFRGRRASPCRLTVALSGSRPGRPATERDTCATARLRPRNLSLDTGSHPRGAPLWGTCERYRASAPRARLHGPRRTCAGYSSQLRCR